jgi:hypothetical protein
MNVVRLLHHSKRIMGGLEDPEIVQVAMKVARFIVIMAFMCSYNNVVSDSDKCMWLHNVFNIDRLVCEIQAQQ